MSRKETDSVADVTERELVITRLFDAPRENVWKAWTEPERLMRWWGPRGFVSPGCEIDLRPGGAWRVRMHPATGDDLVAGGVYREIVVPERLVFTYVWEHDPFYETLVRLTFADQGGKTLFTFYQGAFRSVESRDDHRGGWTESLDMLGEYLAAER